MKRTPLSRKTPLRAKSELKRGTVRLRPVNRKRLAKLRAALPVTFRIER